MKSSLLSLSLLLSLIGSAQAGVPNITPGGLPGLPGLPLEQTIVCSDGQDGKMISLTGTLVETLPAANVKIMVTQDHVKFVAGNLTLSVSDAFDVVSPSDFFMSFPVGGSHKAGMPTFGIGQGYVLRQTDTNPLLPVIETLVIEEIQAETAILQATLKFAGQETAKVIDCQIIKFDLNQ